MLNRKKRHAPEDGEETVKRSRTSVQVLQRLMKNRSAMFGLALVLIMILLSVLAPLIAPYDPNKTYAKEAFQSPSLKHLMGTDNLGRDQFSRLLYGGRYSLGLGFTASILAAVFGILLGCLAGFFGGWVDNLIMRSMDVIQAIPGMLLSIVISTVLGSGLVNTAIALCIGGIAGTSRMLRARILSERRNEYLEAAESINCSKGRIMFKHLLPNTISPLIVNMCMGIGGSITGAAGLSYIGLGVRPPTAEWGALLTAGKNYVTKYPYMLIWPGIFIAITVLGVNLLGDGLRDALDPRLKK